jgi:hypothetical protein
LQQFSLKSSKICCLFFCKNQNSFCFSEKFRKNKALFCKNSTFFSGSVRPRQHGEGRLLRLAHFHCAFCSPPPQVHRVRGGGRSVPKIPREHRWASSMFSSYNEFSVESGSLRAASPGSSWYVIPSTPCKNAPRCSLLS